MARDAEHHGKNVDGEKRLEADVVPARQEHEENARSGADIPGPDQHLGERQAETRQLEAPALDLDGPTAHRDPDEIGDDADERRMSPMSWLILMLV